MKKTVKKAPARKLLRPINIPELTPEERKRIDEEEKEWTDRANKKEMEQSELIQAATVALKQYSGMMEIIAKTLENLQPLIEKALIREGL